MQTLHTRLATHTAGVQTRPRQPAARHGLAIILATSTRATIPHSHALIHRNSLRGPAICLRLATPTVVALDGDQAACDGLAFATGTPVVAG